MAKKNSDTSIVVITEYPWFGKRDNNEPTLKGVYADGDLHYCGDIVQVPKEDANILVGVKSGKICESMDEAKAEAKKIMTKYNLTEADKKKMLGVIEAVTA